MKLRSLATLATTAAFSLLATASLAQSEIYKWTDAEGNVHFGDRPTDVAPAGEEPERLVIASSATNRAAVREQSEARDEARAVATAEELAAGGNEPTEEEKQAAAAERADKCDTYKARMQKLVTSRRVYRQDADGERVYLDEAQVNAEREETENRISEFCGS